MRQRWNALTSGQKLVAMAVLCVVVTVAVGGALAFGRPTMRNLATGMDPETAAGIVKKLDDQKIAYELADGGSTIRVDAAQLNRVRLELASAGLPQKGAAGFELFDRINLSSSDFAERVNYLRAMQGELAETIGGLPGVKSVRVHLNLPKESVFLDEAKAPTASVLLQFEPGAQLTRQQAVGIRNLVASAVDGLTPEAVTVMDAAGSTLFAGTEMTGGEGTDDEERLGRQLQRSTQSLLDNVVGPGRAVASVRVELQRDKRETRTETVQPEQNGKGIEKSRTETEESYLGTNRTRASGTNTTSTPPVRESAGAGEKPSYRQVSSKVEYEISKKVETLEEGPGGIRRLTASVLVDAGLKLDVTGRTSLEQAVSAALGINPRRGDVLEVRIIPFNRPEPEKVAEEPVLPVDNKYLPAYLAAGGFGAVLMLGILSKLFRRKKPVAAADPTDLEVRQVDGVGGLSLELPAEAPLAALPAPGDVVEMTDDELLAEARRAVTTQPEAVARLIQTWLDEDRSKERR